MHYSLHALEAELYVTIAQVSSEVDTDEGDTKGMYVWRGSDGVKTFWSPTSTRYVFQQVYSVAEADSVMFLCPACFAKNSGAVGTHLVHVTFAGRNVPEEAGSRGADGKPTRWNASGTSLDDLVLTPSILLSGPGCGWHGFIGSSGIPAGHAG